MNERERTEVDRERRRLNERIRNQKRELNLITRHMTEEWGVLLDDNGSIDLYESREEANLAYVTHGGIDVVHRWVTSWEPKDQVRYTCPACRMKMRDLSDRAGHKFDCHYWYEGQKYQRPGWERP